MSVPLEIKFPYHGVLALAGSGEYLPAMDIVDRTLLSLLMDQARVVCLPTAAGTEGQGRLDYWMSLGESHFKSLGVDHVQSLPVFSRKDAENPDFIKKVKDANFVYISGGKPYYLMECFNGTGMVDALINILEKKGVVAGCSAGAMIFGERIPNRQFLGGTIPALGWLTGCFVVPHFDEIPFALRFAVPHLVGNLHLIGIEANTVLCCSQEGNIIIGSGGVTYSNGSTRTRYQAG
jgi:cyanophycinase